MRSVKDGAAKVLSVCTNAGADEDIVLVSDDNKLEIAYAFMAAAKELGLGKAVALVMPPQSIGGQEPPQVVARAMEKASLLVVITTHSLSQTKTRMELTRKGARFMSLPDVRVEDLTEGLIEADFAKIAPGVHKLAGLLTKGEYFHVTTKAGCDLSFSARGIEASALDGLCHKKGDFRSLGVEANVGPVVGSVNGTIVVDGSAPLLGPLSGTITCEVKDGYVSRIYGGEDARRLERALAAFKDPQMYLLAEFGIGMNPCARLTGTSYISDESTVGTVHFGLGTNLSQRGNIKAAGHTDLIVQKPTIEIDGFTLMKDGDFKIDLL